MDGVDAPAVMGSSQMKSKISNISRNGLKFFSQILNPHFFKCQILQGQISKLSQKRIDSQ